MQAQLLVPYYSGHKWGYAVNGSIVIKPDYDTAFPFDKSSQVAMVGKWNRQSTQINPLTGEEKQVMDFYFINSNNTLMKLKRDMPGDSISVFSDQQELELNYLENTSVFRVLFANKVWLFSKSGRQLSVGFDNIFPAPVKPFYITELYNEWDKEIVRAQGLIDTTGLTIVTCEKKHIGINTEDSLVYTCSAIFNKRLSDEVFNYKGKLVYTNKNHIEFASKHVCVYKLYDPKEVYMFENLKSKSLYGIEGMHFYYLGRQKALVVDQETWLLVNMQTGKKQKVDKQVYHHLIYKLMEF